MFSLNPKKKYHRTYKAGVITLVLITQLKALLSIISIIHMIF